MAYITVDELRAYTKDVGNLNSEVYETAIAAAEIEINAMCGRFFYPNSAVQTAYYWPETYGYACVDDFYTTTGLLVEVDIHGNGTYSDLWTYNTDFFLEPINQTQGGILGWPYTQITATLASKYLPMKQWPQYIRPTIRLTAKFGWAEVPDPVKQATKIIATKLYKMSEAPFGVAGFDQWGTIRVGNIPEVQNLLGPFMTDRYAIA